MTEPEKDTRTREEKNAGIRSSIITWAVFIGGLAMVFAAVDFFLISE